MLDRLLLSACGAIVLAVLCSPVAAVTWDEAQPIKVEQLKKAAAHAVDQQRKENYPPQAVEATYTGIGNVAVTESTDWDVDGDGKCLKVTLTDVPANNDHVRIRDRLAIRFARSTNVIEKATGLALWIKTPDGLSKDLRFGAHFKCAGSTEDPIIISDTPLVQRFGDNPQQAYLDWGYAFSHEVRPMRGAPNALLQKVETIELTFVQKRLPADGGKPAPASGTFYVDGLQLVDWYNGSYDSDRFPKGRAINAKEPITSQGRTQQVAVICAMYGGEEGTKSAIRAMDMMAWIQCWDGSWPELQTRLQGEFTHGMILADLARVLGKLREQKRPELAEKVTIRQWTMTRDVLYEQMIYRAAMSRAPGPIRNWRDTYCSGEGALTGGCNRPMIYVASQYIAAQVITDGARKAAILGEYDKNMDDLVAYQGKTAGGWPIFGEGDRYSGKGLHWDCGYTTDHVFIMALSSRVTGDKRWGVMMRKFGTVVEAMMLSDGLAIDGGLSERGHAKSGGLKSPDIVYQEAMRHGATHLAQWGANVSERVWSQWPRGGGMWGYAGTARGYGLGAFLTWLTFDLDAEPKPKSLGHVFPRQWPVWTAKWMNKEGKEVRRSKLIVQPGGQMVNTFEWEVGQYPVVTGLPMVVEIEKGGPLEIEPVTLKGDVAKVADGVEATVVWSSASEQGEGITFPCDFSKDVPIKDGLTITEPTLIRVGLGEGVGLAFRVTPRDKAKPTKFGFRLLRKPEPYKHLYAKEAAADVDLGKGGVNLVDPASGTKCVPVKCFPSAQYDIKRAFDKNQGTAWVIGQFKAGSALRFEFAREASLSKVVLSQGDWKGTFHVAKDVTVTLSDGTTKKLSMERKPGTAFEIDLGGAKSKSLTLSVDAVHEVANNTGNVGGWMELEILTAVD